MTIDPAPPLLRPMRADDAAEVAALIRLAFAAQPVSLSPPPSALCVSADNVAAHLRAGHGGVVGDVQPRLVAALLWERQGEALHLSRLAVHPDFRRRGLARRLLFHAEQTARDGALSELSLGTRLALSGNRALFAHCGYIEIAQGTHPGYAHPTRVELRKRLV